MYILGARACEAAIVGGDAQAGAAAHRVELDDEHLMRGRGRGGGGGVVVGVEGGRRVGGGCGGCAHLAEGAEGTEGTEGGVGRWARLVLPRRPSALSLTLTLTLTLTHTLTPTLVLGALFCRAAPLLAERKSSIETRPGTRSE